MSQKYWLDPEKHSTYHVTGETLGPLQFLTDDDDIVYSVIRTAEGLPVGAIIPGRWTGRATEANRKRQLMARINDLSPDEAEDARRRVASELGLNIENVSCWREKR